MAKQEFDLVRKILAYDEAVSKLQEAGLADEFLQAVERDPDLKGALDKMASGVSAAASPGWSCCVTVQQPL